MSHYVIQALLEGNIVYHRETPVRAGVENLINEGVSQLFSVSGGNPGRDAVVEVLRYYDEDPVPEVELVVFADSHEELFFEAEALTKAKGKVRTMSGKPHTPRKLKQDSGISPEEAARRIALKSESKIFYADTMEWDIDYLESYETPYGTKLDGVLYNPTTGESAEFEGITIETSIPDIDPLYANMEDIPTYEAENEDNLGPMFMAESKSTMPKIPKGIKTGGWQQAAYIYSNGDIFSIEDFSEVYDMPVYDIWHHSGNIPKIDAPKNTWIYDDEVESWDWDKILDKAKNQVNKEYNTLRAEEKKNCGCGQDPCVTYGAETFEAPRRKKLDFVWIGEDSSEKEWARTGSHTIDAAIKKAKAEGWKPVMSEYWGDNPATKKSRMRREAKVWNLMSKSPQWKPWLKFLTERNADNEMHETMDIFRGKAYWKDKNRNSVSILGRTQNHGPWIYDEDRIYVPDHFSEDGGWQVLVKGNQALLLYYIADFDGPYSTPLMRKTFNLSPVKATKTAKKAKPKTTKKTTTRKSKPKAKAKTGRKAPTISATKRKIGTRMRGNDGKMWEVKKSGKSQRWMAGAETQTQTFHSSIDSKFDELL